MDFLGGNGQQLTDKERFQFNYLLSRDPLLEFFNLTCQSIKLNSPHINTICDVDCNLLYKKACKDNIPFFKWADWIENFLNQEFLKAILQGRAERDKLEQDDYVEFEMKPITRSNTASQW